MIGADNGNRSQAQGEVREGGAERSAQANRRPYEQERTERQGMGDKCASKHEIQQLSKTCSVESDGAAGKFRVLPREASSEAQVLEEESAEVVVGSGNEREAIPRTQLAEGPKSQGDDLNPHSTPQAGTQDEVRSRESGPTKQKWLPGLWLPNGETGQADITGFKSGDGRKEERKEQAPIGLMEKILSDENAQAALRAVEGNAGAAGIDGMGTKQLRTHLEKHWTRIRGKLLEGTYAPSPVKRVWIDKASGGKRPLGIPTVGSYCTSYSSLLGLRGFDAV
jgi:hypothetical protein